MIKAKTWKLIFNLKYSEVLGILPLSQINAQSYQFLFNKFSLNISNFKGNYRKSFEIFVEFVSLMSYMLKKVIL